MATIRQYDGAYKKWNKFLMEHGKRNWVSDEYFVCKYLRSLEAKDLGERSVNQFLAIMSLIDDLKGSRKNK